MATRKSDWHKALDFLIELGLVYKVGLAVMVIGVISVMSSWFLGGIFYDGVLQVLNSFTDPAERDFLHDPDKLEGVNFSLSETKSEMGSLLMQFLGGIGFAGGALIVVLGFIYHLGLKMLGDRPDEPGLTGGLGWPVKAGLIMAGIGFLMTVSGWIAGPIIYEVTIYDDRESPFYDYSEVIFQILGIFRLIMLVGIIILICGICITILWKLFHRDQLPGELNSRRGRGR